MRKLLALFSACLFLMGAAAPQNVDMDALTKVSFARTMIGMRPYELSNLKEMYELEGLPMEVHRDDEDKICGMTFEEDLVKSSREIYDCETGQYLDNDADYRFDHVSTSYYLGAYEDYRERYTAIVQCVYTIPVQEEMEPEMLYLRVMGWIGSEIREGPFCADEEEKAFMPDGHYFTEPTGLAFAEKDDTVTCSGFSQWLNKCHGDEGFVLTDCAELVDAEDNVTACRVTYTWFKP